MNSQMIDVKILKSVSEISDNVCFVMPIAASIMKEHISVKYQKYTDLFNKRLTYLEIIDGRIFNAAFYTDLGILKIEKASNVIKVNNTLSNRSYNAYSINDINKFDNNDFYKSIKQKGKPVAFETNYISYNARILNNCEFIGLAVLRGHKGSSDWNTIVSNKYELHYKNNKQKYKAIFDNENECKNFYNYLKLKIVRFYYDIYKYDGSMNLSFPVMPTYTHTWTDEDVAKELGLTSEELAWAINWIPDYYPEDAEKYRKYSSYDI